MDYAQPSEPIEAITSSSDLSEIIKTFFEFTVVKPPNEDLDNTLKFAQEAVAQTFAQDISLKWPFTLIEHLVEKLDLTSFKRGDLSDLEALAPKSSGYQQNQPIPLDGREANQSPAIETNLDFSKNDFTPNKKVLLANTHLQQQTYAKEHMHHMSENNNFVSRIDTFGNIQFLDTNQLFESVRLVLDYFIIKNKSSQKDSLQNPEDLKVMNNQKTQNKLGQSLDSQLKILVVNIKIFNDSLSQLINEHSSMLPQLKQIEGTPLGIVGYHIKEKNKEITIKKKKKKKKNSLYQEEVNCNKDNFN